MDETGPIVEYNSLPLNNVTTTWLDTWFKGQKEKFLQRQNDFKKVDCTNIIGNLFLESLEVRVFFQFVKNYFLLIFEVFQQNCLSKIKNFIQECPNETEFLSIDRNDLAFKALLFLPWTNTEDQYMYYVTVKYLMPKATVVARHICEIIQRGDQKTKVKGFKLVLTQENLQWAIHAVMMADPVE